MGNLLNRETLLKRDELKTEKVEFENGDFVYVRQMTGRERDNFEQSLVKESQDAKGNITYERSLSDFRAKLAVCTVCKENGDPIFLPGDYGALSKNISAAKLEKIVNVAQRLNRITDEDKEALVKNSDAVQDGNFNSNSAES